MLDIIQKSEKGHVQFPQQKAPILGYPIKEHHTTWELENRNYSLNVNISIKKHRRYNSIGTSKRLEWEIVSKEK